MSKILSQNLGYPRIGRRRELKKALERHWRGELSADELEAVGADLRRAHWEAQRSAGIDRVTSGDFSFYDHMLDLSCLLGNVPSRFAWDGGEIGLDLMFRMARGGKENQSSATKGCGNGHCNGHGPELACEMTKWFDTNYHYLVPEFNERTAFKISTSKLFDEFSEAKALGLDAVPSLPGPLTYLALGKEVDAESGFDRYELGDALVDTYVEILARLREAGARRIRLDEPAFALDLDDRPRGFAGKAYRTFCERVPDLDLEVAVFHGGPGPNLDTLLGLPVAGFHLDAVRGGDDLLPAIEALAGGDSAQEGGQSLSLGLVDGRNIWKTDLAAALGTLRHAVDRLGTDRVAVAPSCTLLHVPVSLAQEDQLDPEIASWMAFAEEKLRELAILRDALAGEAEALAAVDANAAALASRRGSDRTRNPRVRERLDALGEEQFRRRSPFSIRIEAQRERLRLPSFPTTTIGSFPQTSTVRQARARFRRGEWTREQYETFLRLRTEDCVRLQEKTGLDVLVHGEFERNDMVEHFGELLSGFAFTRYGWVQSYGSRCVKPPVIYGDVHRPAPMTVDWARFAQSLTDRPVKGMLTGPVTILQWSFVRDDQPRRDTAFQIALAIRDEVADLEAAGLPIVQIDEAALREGLPLRQEEWPGYLDWAVRAFRLASAVAGDATQIHTHMCYSEFNDILPAIAGMDADVITIENARSGEELLEAFADFEYPNEIGPGVYDIHSPRVPETEEMVSLLERAARVLPGERLWVNPDCGLKTRGWEEVKPALERMVEAARVLRR